MSSFSCLGYALLSCRGLLLQVRLQHATPSSAQACERKDFSLRSLALDLEKQQIILYTNLVELNRNRKLTSLLDSEDNSQR